MSVNRVRMMTMMMKKLKLVLAVALAIFAGQLVPQARIPLFPTYARKAEQALSKSS